MLINFSSIYMIFLFIKIKPVLIHQPPFHENTRRCPLCTKMVLFTEAFSGLALVWTFIWLFFFSFCLINSLHHIPIPLAWSPVDRKQKNEENTVQEKGTERGLVDLEKDVAVSASSRGHCFPGYVSLSGQRLPLRWEARSLCAKERNSSRVGGNQW